MSWLGVFALLCVNFGCILGHPQYRDLIPNGYTVPNPCGTGFWEPVGHYDPIHHTHDKNPFGLAFSASGYSWQAVCSQDTDRDGRTNGEELGDPGCVWTVGGTPTGRATGHPGICEPIGSGLCASVAFRCGCHGHNCVGK